jgi:LPS export ABC transporter protein LptC
MVAWQKRARLLVLVIAIGVGSAVYLTTGRREPPPPPAQVERADPAATVESTGSYLVQIKGAREHFSISADKQFSYPDGSARLEGARVESERDNKTFVMRGDEMKVNADQSHMELKGKVRLTASDGLEVTAASATYAKNEGLIRVPGAVTFKRGRLSGTGDFLTYDENRDQIGITDKAVVKIAPDEKGAGGADIRSGSALLARKDGFASFERAVHIIRPNQIIDADTVVADLSADEKHITGLDLQGTARMTAVNPAPGAVSAMSGDVIDLVYAEKSDFIQSAHVAGAAILRLAGEQGSAERTLSAQTIDTTLAPDGATVTSLKAADKVALVLPAPRNQPSKTIHSNTLVASGTPTGGLTGAVFTDSVEYRETGGAPRVQRIITSRTLDTDLNGGFGEIRDARFAGNVQFRDGSTQAAAANVRYEVASGRVDLTGRIGNAQPHVENDEIAVDGNRIDMTLAGPKVKATEDVRATMKPVKPGTKPSEARKTPALMQSDRAASASSDELTYDGEQSSSRFSGNAKLWQGADTIIRADTIDLSGKTGNLAASGSVNSTFRVQTTNAETKVKEPGAARGSGETMNYDDAARSVVYKGKAQLNGPTGDIVAQGITLNLGKNAQDVERLEASEGVTLRENKRVTTGDQLVYVAEGEEYTMSGKLVKMKREGCSESTGKVLQFSGSSDKLVITGSDESRTQTKNETTCIPETTPAIPPATPN